jgi:hypothetical protein
VASPFRVRARDDADRADPPASDAAMRVEFVLVLALTTPVLILGIATHRSFGVALTIALFSWIFSAVSLVTSVLRRRRRA